MHDFRRLRVWQLSRELAVDVSIACRRLPASDKGVLGPQLRRASLSIAANIAEGCGKSSPRETIRYLQIAAGSALEVESHLIIAEDLGYLPRATQSDLRGKLTIIQKMLFRLTAAFERRTGS